MEEQSGRPAAPLFRNKLTTPKLTIMFFGILIGLSVIVVSFLGWALWSAKPVVGNEIDAPSEGPPSITYDEIQDCEMPYYGSIYH